MLMQPRCRQINAKGDCFSVDFSRHPGREVDADDDPGIIYEGRYPTSNFDLCASSHCHSASVKYVVYIVGLCIYVPLI